MLAPSSAPSAPSGCPAPALKSVTGGLEQEGQQLAHTLTLAWVRCVLSPSKACTLNHTEAVSSSETEELITGPYRLCVCAIKYCKLAAALDQAPTQEHIRDFL